MKNSRPGPVTARCRTARKASSALRVLALCALVTGPLATPAAAAPELCEAAARQAARETGVPADVLLAISLTETGRRIDGQMRPWPWAANAEGRGHWFASADQAAAFARQRLAAGRPSFDLGCFQINWRWHGQHFDRPEALLDPLVSARYAARFLAALHAETGDWTLAAGAYHSRTPHLAQRYRTRFAQLRAALPGAPRAAAAGPASAPPTPAAMPGARIAGRAGARSPRPIRFALLQQGDPAPDGASLVPQSSAEPFLPGAEPSDSAFAAPAPAPAPASAPAPANASLAAALVGTNEGRP